MAQPAEIAWDMRFLPHCSMGWMGWAQGQGPPPLDTYDETMPSSRSTHATTILSAVARTNSSQLSGFRFRETDAP